MELNNDVNSIPFRPISANFSGLQGLRAQKSRPQSANKGIIMLPRARVKIENRPKPKKNFLSREELTEKLLYFKNQANLLREENIRLKTKVKFLEKDLKKEEPESDKSHLVFSLKTQIKELQKNLENKECEIADLKKTSRVTKFQEIETEMKMYVDECTRLRRMLQETLYQLSMGVVSEDMEQKYILQCIQIKTLKKDYKELAKLTEDPNLQKNKSKKELLILKLKKKFISTKEENIRVSEDNQRLLQEIKFLRNNLRCPNCGYVFEKSENKDVSTIAWDIWQAIEHRRLTLESAWKSITTDSSSELSLDQFKQSLEKLGLFLNQNEAQYFFPGPSNTINFELFSEILQKLRPADLITYQDVKETILHLSYRLQVRRYEFEQISALFFPETRLYYQIEVYGALQQEPVLFTDIQAEVFTKFLFGSCEALMNEECSARIIELIDPWQVLTEQEETQYDQELKKIVQDLGDKLLASFEAKDSVNTGFISFENFCEVLNSFQVQIDSTMVQYLTLLFYTDQFEFNLVPYKNFYQAYISHTNP
jgi:hypothetical protein